MIMTGLASLFFYLSKKKMEPSGANDNIKLVTTLAKELNLFCNGWQTLVTLNK